MEKKNTVNALLVVIIVFLLMILSGIAGIILYQQYDKHRDENKTTEKSNNNDKKDSVIELTAAEKKELLNIVGLTENGYPKEKFNDAELSNANADLSIYNFQSVITNVTKTGDIKINDLSNDDILRIIFDYANDHKLLGKVTEAEQCVAGKSWCESLSFDNYNKIAKIYGITKDGKALFGSEYIYNNNYLFNDGGTTINPVTMTDSVSFVPGKDNVQIVYKLKYADLEGIENKDQTYTYTFKKDSNNNFYLDTINIKNN